MYRSTHKEVYFADWCPSCIHFSKDENELPCNDCLAIGHNTDSHRPLFHKTDKEMKEVLEDIARRYEQEMEMQEGSEDEP